MWEKTVKHLAEFSSAVLTGVDDSGFPFSIRCQVEPDSDRQVLLLNLTDSPSLQPAPASLLCHRHDELIDNMKSFVVRGTLEREAGGWIFRPRQFIAGVGMGFLMGMPRFIKNSRRNAKRYLQNRNLRRPQVNWQEIEQVWAEANQKRQ